MVSLNDDGALARSFAASLGELGGTLTSQWRTEAPEAAFLEWAARRAGLALDIDVPGFDVERLSVHRWSQAPLLATVGYRLSQTSTAEVLERWRRGVAKLMERDVAPPDRNSFLFRPIELLGIAEGVAVLADDRQPAQWLRATIETHSDHLSNTTGLPGVLVDLAAQAVGAKLPPAAPMDATDTNDVSLAVWLHLADAERATALVIPGKETLANRLLARTLTEPELPQALAQVGLGYLALRTVLAAAIGNLTLTGGSAAGQIVAMCRRFPLMVNRLAHRHAARPSFTIEDEYDVQDLLHGILLLHFDDVRVEEWNPSYGGVQSRSDLLLKPEHIVIETKMTRRGLGQRELVQQLIVDKSQYRTHPDCRTLVCFVYDPERRLPNPAAIEADLSDSEGQLTTRVVVAPRGM